MTTKVFPQVSKEYQEITNQLKKTEKSILFLLAFRNTSEYRIEVPKFDEAQALLQTMFNKISTTVSTFVEKQFILGKRVSLTAKNAKVLSLQELAMIDIVTDELMGNLLAANAQVMTNLRAAWDNALRINQENPQEVFVGGLRNTGLTAFTTVRGANYRLESYGDMLVRTAGRQASNLGNTQADPDNDLYQISSHNTTCNICAPLEHRVFSRSGENPNYPPLALAFGLIDPAGPETLENSWLNIHPNCLHYLIPYTEEGKTADEIKSVREFSSLTLNPLSYDPRPQAEIDRYNKRQRENQQALRNYRQYEKYIVVLGNSMPRTYETFLKNKLANTERYQNWVRQYRNRSKDLN